MATNNIEKLHELAGIEKKKGCIWKCHYAFPCEECGLYTPPFSSEKQLELIKWISLNTRYMWNYIGQTIDNHWVLAIDYTQILKFKSCEHTDFSQALAGLVCELWEDLTEEQRVQIQKILE